MTTAFVYPGHGSQKQAWIKAWYVQQIRQRAEFNQLRSRE
jgi:malonyl CoA-acyl carrier protein transacylase